MGDTLGHVNGVTHHPRCHGSKIASAWNQSSGATPDAPGRLNDEAARLVMTVLTTARRIDAACAELLARHDLSEGRLAALLAVSAEPGSPLASWVTGSK